MESSTTTTTTTSGPFWGDSSSALDNDTLHSGNATIGQIITEMKMDIHMFWLMFSLASSILWLIYITFYNSRLIGLVLTKLINRMYFKGDFFRIGSLTFNPLAGKIMFRDVVYVNYDYSLRVQDGYMIFRWWRIYVPKDASEDLSHSDTRLSVMLNGFELHIYNRSELYTTLEKVFGLKPSMLIPTDSFSAEDEAAIRERLGSANEEQQQQQALQAKQAAALSDKLKSERRPEAMEARTWRDLIPVIKVDLTSGRFVFGNSVVPTTLSVCVEEAHCVYSTKPAASRCDHFMHFIKAKAENTKVILAPSPKYTGLIDEPPRFMGEGFVVMMSNLLELYFYMDEPGLVPDAPVLFTLANGDTVEAAPPVWGIDIKCGKGTDWSVGPWADRQRDHLFKFFYPNDFQPMMATAAPQPGELRSYQSFDVSLCMLDKATIDVLFSKNKETSAIHVIAGAGSYMELTIPWVTQTDGFTTKITGQLLHVDATTSLQFRSLAEFETLQFNVKVHYPVIWNDHQEWTVALTGSKATAYIVLNHMDFFNDMIDDWASKQRPDILAFVPYTVKFSILLKEFEIITTSNEFNWIDCSSANQENHHLAFCGDLFDLSFSLPFDDYLPVTVPLKFWIHGEGLDLSMFIPEVSTSRPMVWGIDQNARILTRDGQIRKRADLVSNKWRRVCVRSAWIDCWSVPIVALAIQYIYHPIPPLGPDPQADITTPEKEELLLSPMRIPKHRKSTPVLGSFSEKASGKRQNFDPSSLAPDKVTVEIEIGSSILYAYGAILRNFIHLKDNIFGQDQQFTDMEATNTTKPGMATGLLSALSRVVGGGGLKDDAVAPVKSVSEVSSGGPEESPQPFDSRLYRPFEVTVSLTIHDIQAHVMKNCNDNDPPCPIVLIERLGFEMVCTYTETKLQVLVSPCFLISHDTIIRSNKDRHLRQGHLLLSALQVRGHAMYSNEQRSLDEDTLEYAWMLEVQLGKISGKMTLPQLCHVVTGLETLVLTAVDAENQLKSPRTLRYCHHGMPTHLCPQTKEEARYRCPSSEDIKYRLTRVSVDAVDLYLIENGTAVHTWISPIRLSTCNLHGQQVKSGVTLLISTILVRSFMSSGGHYYNQAGGGNSQSNTNTTGSGRSAKQAGYRKGGGGESAGDVLTEEDGQNRDDLSLLFQRDENGALRCKRESDFLLHRKESKEEAAKRTREEGSGYFKRSTCYPDREDIYATVNSSGGGRGGAREFDANELWLEVGSVSLGSIVVEAASALPIPEHQLHLVQHSFLKMHDEKSKRLWFLWMASVEHSRCGCVGGCSFFGSNRNGLKFFKPSAQDLHDCLNIARYHIHPSPKEYGFGQSLLHEGQLVFHTPPYSIQNVSLQECYEYIGKTNVKGPAGKHSESSNSPILLPKYERSEVSPNSTLRTPCSERAVKVGQPLIKERESPQTMDRRGRRYSYTQTRQPIIPDVPYSRLLDTNTSKGSSSRMNREAAAFENSGVSRSPPSYATHRPSHESRLHRSLRISPPKTSASDSRLTVDYFQEDEPVLRFPEMSSSAPHSNPLEVVDAEEHSQGSTGNNSISTLQDKDLQVQRTVSLTSETEIFFSADEEMHASQRSGLMKVEGASVAGSAAASGKRRFASDLSIGQGDPEARLSSHRSDYEINTPEHRSLPKRPQSTTDMHGAEHKRIHGLATPIRKFNVSPKPEFRHFKAKCDPLDSQDSSSDTPSLSSSSFISALSSQEDVTLVNLQMQANRPIVDSPLLMASYVTHLGPLKCANWSHCSLPFGSDAFSTPLFQQTDDGGGLVYIGGKLIPHFETGSNWKEIRVKNRTDCVSFSGSTQASSAATAAPRSHPWDPSVIIKGAAAEKKKTTRKGEDNDDENEFLLSSSESISRDSIVVRFRGPADIMATPLLLESLQRLIESITPTLGTLHPLTIINYLHQECISKVEADNILKRDQSLSYWSQVHSNSKRSTTERNLQGPGGSVLTDLYEESISTQFQGLILLPKINVTMIQSSVVEEIISFAALDNVHDLSCASVLVVSLESVAARFHLAKTTKAAMHTVYTQPTLQSGNMKKGGGGAGGLLRGTTRALLASIGTQSRPDNIPGEPVLIETSEKQLEELVVTLDVGKAHAQLRRLRNEASAAAQENQMLVTSIPPHLCKAMFEVTRFPEQEAGVSGSGSVSGEREKEKSLGYIMFECGLEGVSMKIVKRSHFEKSENSANDSTAASEVLSGSAGGGGGGGVGKKGAKNDLQTPNLSDRSQTEAKSGSKIGIKLPITPKLSTTKNPLDVRPSREPTTGGQGVKEEVIINIETPKPTLLPGESAANGGDVGKSGAEEGKSDNGKTSSGFIELKTVWFNFAAPPHVPITRKIDYNRLDWNLLSTASPAITAWMNPSNRFAIKLVAMFRAMHQRRTAVTACVMADALEVQGVHRNAKSRYSGKLTPLSKTLATDPSCQLCTIMQRYVQKETVRKIENLLRAQQELPPLTVLRQGVIVLSRQWKNSLYNPMLFEHQYKNKLQPMSVAYASMPQYEEDYDENDQDVDTETYPVNVIDNQHHSLIDGEETERTTLLGQSMLASRPPVIKLPEEMNQTKYTDSMGTTSTPSLKSGKQRGRKMHHQRGLKMLLGHSSTSAAAAAAGNVAGGPVAGGGGSQHSSWHTQMFPTIPGFGGESSTNEYGTLVDGSLPSVYSSSDSVAFEPSAQNPKEDLYAWMAKQQAENVSSHKSSRHTEHHGSSGGGGGGGSGGAGLIGDLKSHLSSGHGQQHGHQKGAMAAGVNAYVRGDANRLLDAHLIFEPLLSSLGVMPQQMVNGSNSAEASLENLGTNLSLVGSFDTLRIDIVVSEACDKKAARGSGGATPAKPQKQKTTTNATTGASGSGKFNLKMPAETPAFLCERVGVDIEVLKVTDGFAEGNKPNVLYISRGQLKKYTNTVINFSLNVKYISQQVNMPLLRLLHQISNMYQNVKQAQVDMKGSSQHHHHHHNARDSGGDKSRAPAKDSSSLASDANDPTLIESVHEASASSQMDVELERYDKFNEFFPIGHSVSRTKMPTLGPLIPLTPSPSAKHNRPQSFAQKLRSTSKSVKGKLGYTNLSETVTTPVKTSPGSNTFDLPPVTVVRKNTMESKHSVEFVSGPLVNEAFVDYPLRRGSMGAANNGQRYAAATHQMTVTTPKCWKTIYHLLELYAQMPDTKTVTRKVSTSPPTDASKRPMQAGHEAEDVHPHSETPVPPNEPGSPPERTRFMVFGVAKIHRTRLLATLSGLKLEAEITALQSSATWRKKARPVSLESSVTGHVGRAMIVLLEGMAPNQQTVVKVTVGKSQTLYSSVTRRGKDKNSGLLSIGPINIDIPQHPVALHGVMTRSSKQLSSTLQELRVTRTSSRLSKQNEEMESPHHHHHSRDGTGPAVAGARDSGGQYSMKREQMSEAKTAASSSSATVKPNSSLQATTLLQPLVMQFNVVLQSLSVQAALLPSLQAQYKMDNVTSTGFTGSKAKFIIDLPSQSLSFTTKYHQQQQQPHQSEMNLPAEALIALPPVHVSAEYVPENAPQDVPIDGVVLKQGGYVAARAEIGEFERCLTTDLLNHLVFVQKVFMREVNEVVQKVYGGEKPVPIWLDDVVSVEQEASSSGAMKRILFSLNIRVKRIQLTATTPCSSAVRFETDQLELHLSNRVKNMADRSNTKLFGKAQIDLKISLGQLIKNVIFDEAEAEFQQYAFFNTTIGLRNAFQDELANEDKELVLITLKRPLIYVQPVAVDKAILVWLNYKNAYEYWAEKRANLNKEIPGAVPMAASATNVNTQQQAVYDKLPFGHLGAQSLSTLYLQLTVEDMGICLPLNTVPLNTWSQRPTTQEFESRGAVVITLENTIISACNSGSLVSKGKFGGLCLRFADDFETSLDDWKPNMADVSIMNLCVVSEGTYEVCSRTIAPKSPTENAKWFLNVKWQMEGVDIHLDVNIGKQLSALGHTLTMLSGLDEDAEDDDDPLTIDSPDSEDGTADQGEHISKAKRKFLESVPSFVFDTSIDPKKRSMMMEKEMSEQLKIISDLRTLGATQNTIAQEERRLQELQAISYKYFRRDMIQKWKRPSSSLRNRPMLKPTNRSQSFIISTPVRQASIESTDQLDLMPEDEASNSAGEDGSPQSGPSRSASLRMRMPQGGSHRVTFNESMRQSSLPSGADADNVFGGGVDWNIYTESDMNILDIDGEQVELRKKSPSHQLGTASAKPQEPNIDFELDVKVFVNSGKCVLHTKEVDDGKGGPGGVYGNNQSSASGTKHHKRERSIGNDFTGSPGPSRKATKEKPRIRLNNMLLTELTIFHIPGLDVKLHYDSKTGQDEVSPRMSACDMGLGLGGGGGGMTGRRQGSKRASLFAWVTLQRTEETIISPHILEFLEQTLEPIPSKFLSTPTTNPVNMDMLQKNYVTYASFPVDVIVYFHMQPSTFRFSCLPVSRVECMLKLPSLDIVFSSKRHEEILSADFSDGKTVSGGGLSVTGCLADFNVYIFHPYGGKKTNLKENRFAPLADSERKDSLSVNVEFVKFHITRSRTLNYEQQQPVKQAKAADQRAMIRFSTIVDIGSASFKYDMRRLTEILAFPKAWYRHSIVRRLFLGDLNIHQPGAGDMEFTPSEEEKIGGGGGAAAAGGGVPSFSKGGGFEGAGAYATDRESKSKVFRAASSKSNSLDSTASPPLSEIRDQITAWETLVLFAVNFKKLNVQMNMGNVMGNVVWLTRAFQSEGRLSIGSTGYKNMHIGIGLGSSTLDAKGGIVGGTIELSKIHTQFRVQEESGFEPSHTIAIKLLALELRLDYMGTSVLMTRISSLNARLRDEWKNSGELERQGSGRPTIILIHSDLSWDQLQMMISKSTTADLLKMYYKLEEFFTQQFKSSKRVFTSLESRMAVSGGGGGGGGGGSNTNSMNRKQMREQQRRRQVSERSEDHQQPGDATRRVLMSDGSHRHWQKPLEEIQGLFLTTLGVPLTKRGTILGGTMELHGQNISLACFHGINFKSKSWALFSLKEPCINFATEAMLVGGEEQLPSEDVNVIQTLTFGLGLDGMNASKGGVGGGGGAAAAGRATTARGGKAGAGGASQSGGATASAASSSAYQQAQNHSMATVVRLSRNIVFPPQFKTLHEWFHYTFANSDIDAVDRFPVLERGGGEGKAGGETNTNSIERQRSAAGTAASATAAAHPKLQDPHHSREVIFALPSLQLHFKTEHYQRENDAGVRELVVNEKGEGEEDKGDAGGQQPTDQQQQQLGKPVVECSFITEFEDHIFVTVDADAFFFLHDLITSYLKEKEKVMANLAVAANHAGGVDGMMQRSLSPNLSGGGGGQDKSGGRSSAEREKSESEGDAKDVKSSLSIKLTTGGPPGGGGEKGKRELHISKEDVVQAINAKIVADRQGKEGSPTTTDTLELEAYMRDWRDFKCKTWHLEPTVRLLSWAGKSIEPYGIDYILNKLGFSHARTTIPKWLQRGFMDPLDKVQTLLMLQLLSMVREDQSGGGSGGNV